MGVERLPYMDLTDLREFMARNSLEKSGDSPEQVHLYNWTHNLHVTKLEISVL